MPESRSLAESLKTLLDLDAAMVDQEAAARLVREEGGRQALDALLKVITGPWVRENDPSYLALRRLVARTAESLSFRLREGPCVYSLYPGLDNEVETHTGKRGQLRCGYGTSLYEFHYEYPVEGDGTPKDQICVLEKDGTKTPIFDWCKQHQITVVCTRCGENITYQVNQFGCRSITQNPAHPYYALMRLGAIQQMIAQLEKDIRRLEQMSTEKEQAETKATQETLENLREEQKRITGELEEKGRKWKEDKAWEEAERLASVREHNEICEKLAEKLEREGLNLNPAP